MNLVTMDLREGFREEMRINLTVPHGVAAVQEWRGCTIVSTTLERLA